MDIGPVIRKMVRCRCAEQHRKAGRVSRLVILCLSFSSVVLLAQAPAQPDWGALQDETMRHYQTLLRFDTMDPPGREVPVAEYLQHVFDQEGYKPGT